ncbi:MAG: tRNA glutamyl-Q(34) synthetase GluQRS [Coriobacteriaceae bacterium]|nr:tRNA glutamyl-Q(34) synthetase GluQRS [Coriobacteriaceae bacterium]
MGIAVDGCARPVIGRFAPSPTGRMHLGNVLASLLAWLSVRSQGGKLVLRIEDLDDRARSGPWDTLLMDDLRWLGLEWDEGPFYQTERLDCYAAAVEKLEDMGLVYPCFCTRAELHAASAPHASDGTPVYAGTCRGLSAAEVAERSLVRPPALRLRVPDPAAVATARGTVAEAGVPAEVGALGRGTTDPGSAEAGAFHEDICAQRGRECVHSRHESLDFGDLSSRVCTFAASGGIEPSGTASKGGGSSSAPIGAVAFADRTYGLQREDLAAECGDFLIRRSDGVYAYQLAVVVDDAEMGVTEVVRGCDLLGSTARQIYLQDLLGYGHPTYAHVPLLVAPDGRRLSKRDRDCNVGELRERFGSPEVLLGRLAFAAGVAEDPRPRSAEQLIDGFSWDAVRAHRANIVVDDGFFA